MEMPVPTEAQSIVFSQAFPEPTLSPISLCWQRWRNQKPSGTPGVTESGWGMG